MAIGSFHNIEIQGISCCVPDNVVKIDDFEESLGRQKIKKFKRTTGVIQKYCCRTDNILLTSDLCYAAANKLFDEFNIDRESIDAVILVTQSPDYIQPATACVLQHRLGLSRDCIAYDVNLGCSGYVYGLHIAASYLQSQTIKKVLLLSGDANVHIDPVEISLFGEAGTATLLGKGKEDNTSNMQFMLETMGEGFRHLIMPYGAYRHGIGPSVDTTIEGRDCFKDRMNGIEVFNFSVQEVPSLFEKFYLEFQSSPQQYDLFMLHQANLIILQQIMKKMNLTVENCPISLDRYGNTSSASIPLGLCDYFNGIEGSKKKGIQTKVISCGFGVGLSLGIAAFTIDGNVCLPAITTNEAFEDDVI